MWVVADAIPFKIAAQRHLFTTLTLIHRLWRRQVQERARAQRVQLMSWALTHLKPATMLTKQTLTSPDMQGHVRTRPSAKFCRKQDSGTCQIRLTKCSHYVSFKGHWQTKKSPVGQCKWNNNKSSCYGTFCLSQYLFTAEVWVIAPPRIFNSFHDVPLEFKNFTHHQVFEFRGLCIQRSSTVTLSLPLRYQH